MRRGAVGQERRAQPMHAELRSGDSGPQFHGRAVVFDTWTMIGSPEWGFRERVADSALDKTLREADVVFLDGHDPLRPVARMSASTLTLTTDTKGLVVDSDLDQQVSYIADLTRNVENGNVKGMSFGFRVTKDEWETGSDDVDERTIREVELIEVSATAFPAYTTTEAGVRSAVLTAKCRRGDLTAAEIRAITGATIIDPDRDTDREALALLGEESEPPTGTRDTTSEPADATRAVDALRLRMQGLAALHGFTPAA